MSLSEMASRRSLLMFFLILVGAVLAWSSLLWLLSQAAAIIFSHHAMAISPLDTIPVSANLAQHWGNPAEAWPPEVRAQLPGPTGFYLVSIVVLVVILLAVIGVLALGYDTGWRRQPVAAEARHSVIVFGPTQMMKTVGIVIPALLEWTGPAMATSVKPDVIQTTRRHRKTRGQVWVYDPTGGLGRPGDTWSPLASCEDWEGARKMGQWLTAAGAGTQQRDAVSEFFEVLGSKYVGPLLFAATSEDRPTSSSVSAMKPPASRSRPTAAARTASRATWWAPPRRSSTSTTTRDRKSTRLNSSH